MAPENTPFESSGDMPYDLRQTYAMGLITPILLEIEIYRSKNDFYNWFEKLTMSLHTNINQKLLDVERKEYEKVLEETITVLNNNPSIFSGKDKSPENMYKVKMQLKKLECWLRDKMQQHGLFGVGWSDDEESL